MLTEKLITHLLNDYFRQQANYPPDPSRHTLDMYLKKVLPMAKYLAHAKVKAIDTADTVTKSRVLALTGEGVNEEVKIGLDAVDIDFASVLGVDANYTVELKNLNFAGVACKVPLVKAVFLASPPNPAEDALEVSVTEVAEAPVETPAEVPPPAEAATDVPVV
jgi:hypothetical protein